MDQKPFGEYLKTGLVVAGLLTALRFVFGALASTTGIAIDVTPDLQGLWDSIMSANIFALVLGIASILILGVIVAHVPDIRRSLNFAVEILVVRTPREILILVRYGGRAVGILVSVSNPIRRNGNAY